MDVMTREEAHAALMAEDTPQEVEQAAPEAEQEPVVEQEGEAAPAEQEAQEETPQEEQAEEAEAEPVAAPEKWDAEDKAWFAEQSPEIQAKLLEQETKRETVLAKAKMKASEEARKEVEGQISEVQAVAESLKEWLPKAVAAFQQDYGEPDWQATLQKYGSEATMQMKFEYEERQNQLRRVVEAQQKAEALAHEQFKAQEGAKLVELAPELASDATKQREVATYLMTSGAKQSDLDNIPAWAAVIAYKAHLYDKAQAAAKAPPTPKPAATPAKPVLKPAATPPGSSEERSLAQTKNSFAQTGSRDTAHELILKLGL